MVSAFSTAMDIVIPGYWCVCAVTLWRLLVYIRQRHPTTWASLGHLTIPDTFKDPNRGRIYWANSRFVFWSLDYSELHDARLTKQIWLVRAETVCWFALLTVDFILKAHGGR